MQAAKLISIYKRHNKRFLAFDFSVQYVEHVFFSILSLGQIYLVNSNTIIELVELSLSLTRFLLRLLSYLFYIKYKPRSFLIIYLGSNLGAQTVTGTLTEVQTLHLCSLKCPASSQL